MSVYRSYHHLHLTSTSPSPLPLPSPLPSSITAISIILLLLSLLPVIRFSRESCRWISLSGALRHSPPRLHTTQQQLQIVSSSPAATRPPQLQPDHCSYNTFCPRTGSIFLSSGAPVPNTQCSGITVNFSLAMSHPSAQKNSGGSIPPSLPSAPRQIRFVSTDGQPQTKRRRVSAA